MSLLPLVTSTVFSTLFSLAAGLAAIVVFLKTFRDRTGDNLQRATQSWRELYESEQAKFENLSKEFADLKADLARLQNQIKVNAERYDVERRSLTDTIRETNKLVAQLRQNLHGV